MAKSGKNIAEVKVAGGQKGGLLLSQFEGEERLGRPFSYDLHFLSSDLELDLSDFVGQTLSVSMQMEKGGTRYINGYISSFHFLGVAGNYAEYQAIVRPWFWLLSHRRNCRIFQTKSVVDIIKTVFSEHGFSNHADFSKLTTSKYGEREYLVQYNESDFDFLTRLMEEEGIYYYFEHKEDKHVLVLADSYGAHSVAKGYSKVPYFPPNRFRDVEHFDQWRVRQRVNSGTTVLDAYDFTRPKVDLTAQNKVGKKQFDVGAPSSSAQMDLEIYEYPGKYLDSKVGEGYARSRMEGALAEFEVVQAEGDLWQINAGHLFTLEEFPRADQNREYLILGSETRLKGLSYESFGGTSAELDFRNRIEAIPSNTPYRLDRQTPRPTIRGPQTAVVVGPKNKEIWTDEYGRIKVQFHWDREGKLDDKSSCWIRVSQVWAGAKWGAIHIPRVGQEVIVEFLEGDPDQPIVTGRVYNNDNMPPYPLSKSQTQSGIKSHSTEKGGINNFNELRFEDKKGDEHIFMQAEKDLQILVKNDESRKVENDRVKEVVANETVTIGKCRTEEVGEDEKVTVKGNRLELVEKDETLTVKGLRSDTVEKDETVLIKGNRSETVSKNETIKIEGDRSESVDGKENLAVKGDRKEEIGGGIVLDVGKDRSETVGGKQDVTVDGTGSLTVKGKMAEDFGDAHTLDVAKDQKITISGARTLSVSKDNTIKSRKKIVVSAGSQLELKCGAASIILKASGDVEIKGTNLKMPEKGMVSLDGMSVGIKGKTAITLG